MFVDILSNVEHVTHLAEEIASEAITEEEKKQLNPTEQVVYKGV